MKQIFFKLSLALPVILAGTVLAADRSNAEDRPGFMPIPEKFGYFQENKELDTSIAKGDVTVSRAHAWSLFAGMMQPLGATDPNSWPI